MRVALAAVALAACQAAPDTSHPDDTAGRSDTDPAACVSHPETCNGADDDCDGAVDLPLPADAPSWFLDEDGDGYGTEASVAIACSAPDGYAPVSGDCDDTRPGVYPGAPDPDPTCGDEVGDCDATESCRYGGVYDLVNADAVVLGDGEDVVGGSVMGVGDLDGDGFGEVVSGPFVYGWNGQGDHAVDTWKARIEGVNWRVGAVLVGPAGDFDGDGVPDLLFSRWAEPDDPDRSYELWLIPGPIVGSIDASAQGIRLDGGTSMDLGGPLDQRRAAAMVGDVDGDGFDDAAIACGSRQRVGDAAVCVLPGSAGGSDRSADAALWADSATGSSLVTARLGDTDGDGRPDFGVGAKALTATAWGAGGFYVFTHLPTGEGLLSDADALLTGANDYEEAGFDLDGAGDVNGDGYDDVIVGNVTSRYIPDETVEQLVAASLVLGPVSSGSLGDAEARFVVPNGWEGYQGVRVRGAGDLDGVDGDEVLIGLPGWGGWDWPGSVFAHGYQQGVVNADEALVEFRGEQEFRYLGWSFDGVGDVDGDGRADLAFGDVHEPGWLGLVTGHTW